jgi:hypothetical protein
VNGVSLDRVVKMRSTTGFPFQGARGSTSHVSRDAAVAVDAAWRVYLALQRCWTARNVLTSRSQCGREALDVAVEVLSDMVRVPSSTFMSIGDVL